MNAVELKKYNVCNMLLEIVAYKCPNTKIEVAAFARALQCLAEKFDRALNTQTANISKYLKERNEVTGLCDKYINWFNHELGRSLSSADLTKAIDINPELEDKVADYRKKLVLDPLVSRGQDDSGFYPIYINKLWTQKSIANLDLNDHEDYTSLENFMLYQAYSAANLWDEVTRVKEYPLPTYCRNGLEELFKLDVWKNFIKRSGIFLELGTGAPIKTALILDQLRNTKLNHFFVWVDASTPMLEHNVSKIDKKNYPNLEFIAVATNFVETRDLLDFLERKITPAKVRRMPKCFFILGFTLSNLDEVKFFKKYADGACQKGDVLIFPIQFIPEEYNSNVSFNSIQDTPYCRDVINAYNSAEGQKLVAAGLSQIKGLTKTPPSAKALPIKSSRGVASKDCIGRKVEIQYMAEFNYKNRMGHNRIKNLEIIKTSRYFEKEFVAFLAAHRFEVKGAIPTATDTKTLFVEFVGESSSASI